LIKLEKKLALDKLFLKNYCKIMALCIKY